MLPGQRASLGHIHAYFRSGREVPSAHGLGRPTLGFFVIGIFLRP